MEENTSPATALMSISAVGRDCCGSLDNLDLSQVQILDLPEPEGAVNA